ncbi:hypothetical protein FQN60_006548 [Etheostoma spectabile]|uniref:C2H2-type domain-containing protein n=1 Tax=Etheostoma spectabile TaxID=54343 RepID=A0A5J5CEH5_9PERO|nr:hypothetical protein FQN60_006548 [Etheostoma spectabile]
MPRRKQSNPQPVKLELEDGAVVCEPGCLVLESDFLLSMTVFSLSVEDDPSAPTDSTFPAFLSCKGCGQLLGDSPLGAGLDLGLQHEASINSSWVEEADRTISADSDRKRRSAGKTDGGAGDIPSKLFSCSLCPFTSRYSNHLKRHMRTHDGQKPYRCLVCPYASAQLVNLQRHARTHTGEKPYRCHQLPPDVGGPRVPLRPAPGPPFPPVLPDVWPHAGGGRPPGGGQGRGGGGGRRRTGVSSLLVGPAVQRRIRVPPQPGRVSGTPTGPSRKHLPHTPWQGWKNQDAEGLTMKHISCENTNAQRRYAPHKITQTHKQTPELKLRRNSDSKLPLFGRALRSEVKLDPLELLGKKYKIERIYEHIMPAWKKLFAEKKLFGAREPPPAAFSVSLSHGTRMRFVSAGLSI